MQFDNDKPIYVQIADNLCDRIVTGEFAEGGRIPSVREWGGSIGVNPNTVARSYELLETRGVIFNQRGIGFFVSENACSVILEAERKHFLEQELPAFIARAEKLGINILEVMNII